MKEQVSGEAVGWFDGLPWQMWVGVFIAWVVICVLILLVNRMPHDADLRVRGWEDRQKQTGDEDEWWSREYPLGSEEVDDWDWSQGRG